jgi:rhodanese-related sulfurtransferase
MFGLFKKDSKNVIHVNDMEELIGKVELIDIREPFEYKSGSIRSAKNVPMDKLIKEPNKYMSKDKQYYLMCQSGVRSARTCNLLMKQGYNVMNVAGGIGSYVGTKRI